MGRLEGATQKAPSPENTRPLKEISSSPNIAYAGAVNAS